jgi:hypothetical protein
VRSSAGFRRSIRSTSGWPIGREFIENYHSDRPFALMVSFPAHTARTIRRSSWPTSIGPPICPLAFLPPTTAACSASWSSA